MLELRILSGYHRGATLPLGDDALSVGGSEEADVVLADPGLAADHARLTPGGGAWVLEPVDGPVRGDADNAERDRIPLGDGGFARVGPIWMTVCRAGSPWVDPPPAPADLPAAMDAGMLDAGMLDDPAHLAQAPELSEVLAEAVPAPTSDVTADTMMDATADATMNATADATVNATADATAVRAASRPARASDTTPRRGRGARMILVPLTAVAVLSAAAAYAWTAHPAPVNAVTALRQDMEPREPRRLAPAQLRDALRKRLAETDLLARVTLELDDRQWTIRASLGDEESERLQRMLRGFEQRYALDIPVHVRIGSPETMLPFRITQVLSGNDPSIVLDDGRRLYVGDEYRGVRLAAVAGNQLRFTGKQNLDVAW